MPFVLVQYARKHDKSAPQGDLKMEKTIDSMDDFSSLNVSFRPDSAAQPGFQNNPVATCSIAAKNSPAAQKAPPLHLVSSSTYTSMTHTHQHVSEGPEGPKTHKALCALVIVTLSCP